MTDINFTINQDQVFSEWYKLNDDWNKPYIDIETNIKLSHKNKQSDTSDNSEVIIESTTSELPESNAESIDSTASLTDDEIINKILLKEIILNKKYTDNYIVEITKDLNTLINYVYFIGYNKDLIDKKIDILRHMIMTLSYLNMLLNIPKLNRREDYNLSTSSYKFCQRGQNCNQQYPDNVDYKISCNFTHYHFNLLLLDIEKIVYYLTSNQNSSKLKNITELFSQNLDESNYLKCVQTLKYVINNMYRELTAVTTYYKGPITFILRKARRRN